MNATKNLLTNLCNLLVCAFEAFRYGLTFLRAILCSRAVPAAKLLAVESQLVACKQRIDSNRVFRRFRGRKEQKNLMEGLKLGKTPRDSNNDGMPDQWEMVQGLDKMSNDANRKMPSGYTAIEECLNELVGKMIGNEIF